MKIKPEDLARHLAKSLLPVYLIYGDEPLLVQEACDQLRAAARSAGIEDRHCFTDDRNFDWNYLLEEANSLSLFSQRKLFEVRVESGRFNEDASKALEAYCNNPPTDNLLLLISGKIETATTKKKWFTTLDRTGVIVQIWPIKSEQLPAWLTKRLAAVGFAADADALTLLQEQIEGNLLAAHQEIEKLRLLTDASHLDLQTVQAAISNNARYNGFDLNDACLKGDALQAIRILRGLEAEGVQPIALLGLLMRTVRILQELHYALANRQPSQSLLTKHRVFLPSQPFYVKAARRIAVGQYRQIFTLGAQIDECAKGLRPDLDAWSRLSDLCLLLCQGDSRAQETTKRSYS